ncbi:50S ribosomal protein L11 methyltransferase [Syntrophorhabdus aromaticivorans]|uniref:Methyltransferase n=1 Tax=Syntrophorhabdus aromaticivorans TaxID=328301 RepID=A0A971RZX9_9BACT|nr:50S ribosomal protein L11 methyltransferase [Syntrophorhabdus aromaticivorans]NLW34471.1 methyltransferase [Syntrophorhabdus aromaticivorans]
MKPSAAGYKTRVDILVEKGHEELIPEHLYGMTGSGFWIEEKDGAVLLRCYPEDPETFLQYLCSSGLKMIEVNTEREQDRDYSELTRQYFRPIRIGDLIIRPPWSTRKGKGREIVIEPGMAFGTGRHESTRIMLKLMNHIDLRDKNVLDLGTGSGILALYAHLLGARKITAVDNDIDAVLNMKKNLTLNEARNVDAVCADLRDIRGTFDIVLANLDINTFTRHSRDVAGCVKKGGYMVVSGILGRDRKRLVAFFPDSTLITMEQKNAWRGFLFKHETPVS